MKKGDTIQSIDVKEMTTYEHILCTINWLLFVNQGSIFLDSFFIDTKQ